MRIAVLGLGHIGLANAVSLAQIHDVIGYDIDTHKIADLRKGVLPFYDKCMEEFIRERNINIEFTSNFKDIVSKIDIYIITVPTDFDYNSGRLDTSIIESILEDLYSFSENCVIIIRSTVPIGFTDEMSKKYSRNIFFVPEFLREGTALLDCLNPSRIIVGGKKDEGQAVANIFKLASIKNDVPILLMGTKEAEAVKLFANTFLATKVSFFNELDIFAEQNNLITKEIVLGIGLDDRVGNNYNNPSFGYGGYCLPKDTKQLRQSFAHLPCNIIEAAINSNEKRKSYIVEQILKKNPKLLGIYRLVMKKDSDSLKESASLDILNKLIDKLDILVYEPKFSGTESNFKVTSDFNSFINDCDLIIADRYDEQLDIVREKVYTRDIEILVGEHK